MAALTNLFDGQNEKKERIFSFIRRKHYFINQQTRLVRKAGSTFSLTPIWLLHAPAQKKKKEKKKKSRVRNSFCFLNPQTTARRACRESARSIFMQRHCRTGTDYWAGRRTTGAPQKIAKSEGGKKKRKKKEIKMAAVNQDPIT